MGYRRREPVELDFPPEKPSVLPEILRVHLEDLGYGMQDLAQILHVYEDDFRRMHHISGKPAGSVLRIVK